MKLLLRVVLCGSLFLLPVILCAAEVRTFREANGRTHTGTFQKVQGDKVLLRVRNKTSQVSFWSLSKADQLYVLDQAKGDPLAASALKAAEDPRDWTDSRGNKTSARFVELKAGAAVSLVIDGNRTEFPFGNFSQTDQDYIRNQVRGTPSEKHLPDEPAQGGAANPVGQNPANPMPQTALPGVTPGFPMPAGNVATIPSPFPTNPGAVPGTTPGFPNAGSLPMNPPPGHSAVPTATPGFPTTTPNATSLPSNNFPSHNAVPSSATPTVDPATAVPQMHNASPTSNFNPSPTVPPALAANRPGSPVSNSDMVTVYTCSNCKRDVGANATMCRHCGITFDYVEDEHGNRTTTGIGAAKMGWAGFRIIVFLVIPFLVWLGKKLTNQA